MLSPGRARMEKSQFKGIPEWFKIDVKSGFHGFLILDSIQVDK